MREHLSLLLSTNKERIPSLDESLKFYLAFASRNYKEEDIDEGPQVNKMKIYFWDYNELAESCRRDIYVELIQGNSA